VNSTYIKSNGAPKKILCYTFYEYLFRPFLLIILIFKYNQYASQIGDISIFISTNCWENAIRLGP